MKICKEGCQTGTPDLNQTTTKSSKDTNERDIGVGDTYVIY